MNEFASTSNPNTQGLLKNDYEPSSSPVGEALRRRLKKKQQELVDKNLATDRVEEE